MSDKTQGEPQQFYDEAAAAGAAAGSLEGEDIATDALREQDVQLADRLDDGEVPEGEGLES